MSAGGRAGPSAAEGFPAREGAAELGPAEGAARGRGAEGAAAAERRRLWGPETEKALANFGPGSTPRALIAAYAKVKRAAVEAVQETEGRFDAGLFPCLVDALDEIAAGLHDGQFPLSLRQGGAGTSLNMNLNEVAAARARELFRERTGSEAPSLDPIEDVNRAQSTNDTFPTAVTIVAYELVADLESKIVRLQEALVAKELEYETILMAGRTELQDALPIRLGQIFGAWAGCAERDRWRFNKLKERLRTTALGGTAIGTCFAASPAYMHAAERRLRSITGLPLSRSQNLPDEIAHQDKLAEAASGIGLCAGNLKRICGDLLLYTSSLSGELRHPELQYGSTIMPAKSNPVLLEYARGQAMAAEHEATAARDYAFEGQLQLNAYLPFLAEALMAAGASLSAALTTLSRSLIPILEPRRERIAERLAQSNVLLNLLSPALGYRRVKELAAEIRAEAESATAGSAESATAGTEAPESVADESTTAGAREASPAGAAATGGTDPAAARLEQYIDLVSRKTGMPRAEIARRFDPFRATSYVPEGGNPT
jgi:aspartate ammonia-lyase